MSSYCKNTNNDCPMPQLGIEIRIAYNELISNPHLHLKDSTFVTLLEKSFYKYNCKRSFDKNPVPALWLCDSGDIEKWIEYLSKMNSTYAKKLFGSRLFRSVLDGSLAEQFFQLSKEVEYTLKNPHKLIEYDFKVFPYLYENNYKEHVKAFDGICRNIKVTASSHLNNMRKFSYLPDYVADINLSTAWIEGAKDYGIGETITIIFNDDTFINGLVMKNGYAKNATTWENNTRIKSFNCYINGEIKYKFNLLDISGFQFVKFAERKFLKNESLVLEIIDVFPGKKYKDAAITELYPLISF